MKLYYVWDNSLLLNPSALSVGNWQGAYRQKRCPELKLLTLSVRRQWFAVLVHLLLCVLKLSSTRDYLRDDSKSSNSNQSYTRNKVWWFFPNKWVFPADVSVLVILKVPACSSGAHFAFSEGESAVPPARCHLGPQQWSCGVGREGEAVRREGGMVVSSPLGSSHLPGYTLTNT